MNNNFSFNFSPTSSASHQRIIQSTPHGVPTNNLLIEPHVTGSVEEAVPTSAANKTTPLPGLTAAHVGDVAAVE